MKNWATHLLHFGAIILAFGFTTTSNAQTGCHALFEAHQVENTLTINFTDLSTSPNTITSWLWEFADGQTSTEQNPSHTYSHDGLYGVCLTIHDDHGCSNTFCHHITVIPVSAEGCQASYEIHQLENTLTIDFTDLSTSANTITSWFWDFGDGNTSTDQEPSHTYLHDGVYEVCLTIHDDHGCSSTICHHIEVNPVSREGCHALFESHQMEHALTINFTDLSTSGNTILSWLWNFGDGDTSFEQNPSHTYAHAGTYEVCLTIQDDHECSNTFCHPVTVHHVSEEGCHALFEIHQAEHTLTINFSDLSTSANAITSWLWNFGDGNTSTEQNPSYTYAHTGTYEVCLTIQDDHECSSTLCHHIEVSSVSGEGCHAAYSFEADSTGNGIQFINTSTGTDTSTTYLWDFGDGNSYTEENPYHTYTHTGHYTVCLFITDQSTGCNAHYCHVAHIHQGGEGHHSDDPMTFHPHNGIVPTHRIHEENGFRNYPNPFNAFTTLMYQLSEEAEISIDLYDWFGHRISQLLPEEKESAGIHTHLISAENMNPGFYLVRWNIGNESYVKVIAVAR